MAGRFPKKTGRDEVAGRFLVVKGMFPKVLTKSVFFLWGGLRLMLPDQVIGS